MKQIFNNIFRNLIKMGVTQVSAMVLAWKIAKLQGKKSVSFWRVVPKTEYANASKYKTERDTEGNYCYYVSKDKEVIITYKDVGANDIRSFRLNNLIE
jgi:hypothetical protein